MIKFTDWMDKGRIINEPQLEYSFYREQKCKALLLKDGTKLSIQASGLHYCKPCENSPAYDYYDSFEIGFPSKLIEEFLPYADDPDDPTATVYGQVPKELIQTVVDSRGGVVGVRDLTGD